MAGFLDPFSLPFGRSRSEGNALAGVGSRYHSGRWDMTDPFMIGWQPILREPQVDTREAWRAATAQAMESMHTSGWVSGGLASARGQILFEDGLRLNLKPYGGLISSDPKIQAAWARDVEGRFSIAMRDPRNVDWGGRYSLAQLLGQAINQYYASGEIVATLPYQERVGTTHGTKLNVLPSSRLSQADGPRPGTVQGVTLDQVTGEANAYTFENYNYATGVLDQRTVEARDPRTGRRQVMHILDNGPGAVRGITPFAPALRIVRQSDQLANSMHINFMLQTIFAATMESSLPTEDILRALQTEAEGNSAEVEGAPPGSFMDLLTARTAWYENTKIDIGQTGKIAHLFPGEKLNFNRPNSPSLDYRNYQKYLLMEIARALGITTYQLTGDFEGFTYTTAKMAVDEIWPATLWRRALIAQLAQAVFEAWLEEDVMRGFTVLPGGMQQFYAQRGLICNADWRGPPRPTADDLKTAKAKQIERAEGWSSTERIAAEYGNDWVEMADSQAASDEYREEKKLPPLPSLGGGGNGAGSAAVADNENESADARQERDARLVGAMVRGDQNGVEKILMEEDPGVRRQFAHYLAHHAA